MKKSLLILLMISGSAVYSQRDITQVAKPMDLSRVDAPDTVKPWTMAGTAALNITQASFTNWSSGGQNSLGVNAFVNFKADYQRHKNSWKNNLDLAYGFQYNGNGSKALLTKSDDKIEYTTSYGYALSKHWDLTLLANFRTQFTNGYNYPNDSLAISRFMAPGYLVAGIGVSYIPAEYFMLYMSPCAGRLTFVMDDTLSAHGAFGVDKGKKVKGEFGPYVRAIFTKDIMKNVNLNTSLELFTDYLKKFGNIDLNWNLLLTLKVNKWLAASVTTQLIYDDDVMLKTSGGEGPRTQFKEVIGVGITYKFK
jgi:hypothetical protein